MPVVLRRIDGGNFGFGTLGNAVGIQKLAAQIYDQISPPVHFQPGFSVTSATCWASRFSWWAACKNAGTSLGSRTTAMRS